LKTKRRFIIFLIKDDEVVEVNALESNSSNSDSESKSQQSNNTDEDDTDTDTDDNDSDEIASPKFIADLFESVAGAIYIDSNCSLKCVWSVYYKMFKPFISKLDQHLSK
jgi:dsRNA-specific ribonuclease